MMPNKYIASGAKTLAAAMARLPPVARYAIVGIVNTLSDLAMFATLGGLAGVPPAVANVISYSVASGVSFMLNRSYTFGERRSHPRRIALQFAQFSLINLGGLLISTLIVYLFAPALGKFLAKILSIPIVVVWGYLLVRAIVFGHGGQRGCRTCPTRSWLRSGKPGSTTIAH